MLCFAKSISRVAANRHAILLTSLRTNIATNSVIHDNLHKSNNTDITSNNFDNEQNGIKKEEMKPITQQLYKSTHRGSGVVKSWHAPHSAKRENNKRSNNNNYTNGSMNEGRDGKSINNVIHHSQEKLRQNGIGQDNTVGQSMPHEQALYSTRSSCAEDVGPVPERPLTPLQRRQLQMQNKAAFVLSPQALRRVKYLLSQYKPTQNNEHNNSPQTRNADKNKTTNTIKSLNSTTEESANNNTNSESSKENKEVNMVAEQETFVKPNGIRIGVRRRGCSGYSYTVNYHFPTSSTNKQSSTSQDNTLSKSTRPFALNDVIVEQDGVQVVVAADALFYVIGTQMDYVVRDVEEKFVFANPNQKYSCGCEESFMPYDDDDDRED